jgi:hypothetical protein
MKVDLTPDQEASAERLPNTHEGTLE